MKTKYSIYLIIFIILGIGLFFSKNQNSLKISTSRLLINVDSKADFSSQDLAKAAKGTLVQVDNRNPFKSLQPFFKDSSLIILKDELDQKKLRALAKKYGYRYLHLSKETFEEALYQIQTQLKNIPKFSNEIPYLSQKDSQEIYDLMHQVDKLFTKHHIHYWATAGTLLGAVRHQGLIPWDDDLDIAIFEKDEYQLKQMQDVFEQAQLEIHYYFKDFYKIYAKNGTPIPDINQPGKFLPFKYPFIDVFVMTLEKNKEHEDIYIHRSNNFYFIFNNERFQYAQLEKLVRVPFGPITIPIPQKPELFLNQAYGIPEHPLLWQDYAIEPTWNHKKETSEGIQGAAYVKINDFSPASFDPSSH